jgi:lipid-A-disaccharide synthase-like uncharacterized protein
VKLFSVKTPNTKSLSIKWKGIFEKEGILNPSVGFLMFATIFMVFCYLYNYGAILFYKPQGVHQWRQADCLSFTDHFYQENRNFLEPAMHFQGYDGSGQTLSEFPILYYSVAKIWKVTGKQEYVFRLLQLSIFFMGLLALFKLSEFILKDSFWGLFVAFGMFTSTFLAYYANNFLADVPALSLTLIAWYWIAMFYKTKRSGFLYLGIACIVLAGLLKISSALSFFVFLFLFALRKGPIPFLSWDSQNAWGIYTRKIWMGAFFILGIWACWYSYARWYNDHHNYGIFLIGILPIWELDSEGIRKVLYGLLKLWRQHFFRDEMLFILSGLLIWLGIKAKDIPTFPRAFLGFTLLGGSAFLLLFFQVFDNHDYYALNLLVLFPALILTGLLTLEKTHKSIYTSWWVKCVGIILIIHCADFTRRRMISRYERNDNKHTGVYENITPWLRSLHIQRNDKVLSLGDNSPNASLYLMDQKGWSDFAWLNTDTEIKDKIRMGAKYLIVKDTLDLNRECLQPFKERIVGTYSDPKFPNQKVEVWKLKSE